MKFYIYNILEKGRAIKQLLTWDEIKEFAQEVRDAHYIQTKAKLHTVGISEEEYLQLDKLNTFWFYIQADTEYAILRILKVVGYTVTSRQVILDVEPKVTVTNTYERFSNIPEDITDMGTERKNLLQAQKKGKKIRTIKVKSPNEIAVI